MFDQPYVLLLFIGLAFTAAGFLVRDELWLRLLVLTGGLFNISFSLLQFPILWGSVITNAVLAAINLLLIAVVTIERSLLFMSESDRIAFRQFKTLTPGQFRRINRWAKWHEAADTVELLREGEKGGKLFFINAHQFEVTKRGKTYMASGPAFAGEMMLLQGGAASATVSVPAGTQYAEWSGDQLLRAMKKSKHLENALIARFSLDLADKLRNSAPLAET